MKITLQEQEDLAAVWRWIKAFRFWALAACLVGTGGGILVSFFMPKQYASNALVLVANTTDGHLKGGSSPFGLEMHLVQMMEVLRSDLLKDSLIAACDWKTYWKKNPEMATEKRELYRLYDRHLSLQRGYNLSLNLRFTATEPATAQLWLKTLIRQAPAAFNRLLQNTYKPMLDSCLLRLEKQAKLVEGLQKISEETPLGDSLLHRKSQLDLQYAQQHYEELLKQRNSLLEKTDKYVMPLFVLRQPDLPSEPSSPDFILNACLGAAICLLLSLCLWVWKGRGA